MDTYAEGQWLSIDGETIGYCKLCGRELRKSYDKEGHKCPLCLATIHWDYVEGVTSIWNNSEVQNGLQE